MTDRTTVRLPEALVLQAKRRAAADGRTLTSLIEEGLRHVLADKRAAAQPRSITIPVSTAKGWLKPPFKTLRDVEEFEDQEYVQRLRDLRVILPDVNVLIYAFRVESPFHAASSAWLARTIGGEARFGVSPLTLSALVRITTNRRAFDEPSTLDQAFGFCQFLMDQPNCQLVEPGVRHFSIFRRLCTEADIRGRDVTDAWFAALSIEHGCEWITFDRDFARFAALKQRAPD